MATLRGTEPILEDSFIADEALSQYQAVIYGSVEGHVTVPAASGDVPAGIVQEDADASGDVVRVMQIGKSLVNAAVVLAIGAQLQIHDVAGNVATPTAWASGDGFVGYTEEASTASGDQICAMINVKTLNR